MEVGVIDSLPETRQSTRVRVTVFRRVNLH